MTDCNLILGKLHPDLFPKVFGKTHDRPLDKKAALKAMAKECAIIKKHTGRNLSQEEAAEGFISVAVEHMARAVKKISVQKGHDITKYTLVSFGGAGGQHAALVADALGIRRILIHPLSGVLSALGIGQTGLMTTFEQSLEKGLGQPGLKEAEDIAKTLEEKTKKDLISQGAEKKNIQTRARIKMKYKGSDTALAVLFEKSGDKMKRAFERAHETLFGFYEKEKPLVIQSLEVIGLEENKKENFKMDLPEGEQKPVTEKPLYRKGEFHDTPVFRRKDLKTGKKIKGPAIILEDHGTNVIEPGWGAVLSKTGNLILERIEKRKRKNLSTATPDPILLEIFNNRFMNIAEEMGAVLENTAHSVNIKERLDFSCALFDPAGDLVANAPHMPVHLGSMSESVKTIARANKGKIKRGDAYLLNDPYHGGTHLPDVTVVVPVFLTGKEKTPDFFVASRGHHADIGGLTPGSMPPDSKKIEEEGVLFDNFKIMKRDDFREADLRAALKDAPYPSRNPDQNIADIKAQLAACTRGIKSLQAVCDEFGEKGVKTYMGFIQDNAENAVREVLEALGDGEWTYPLDNGLKIRVGIKTDRKKRTAIINFSGTSKQHEGNFNAPRAVTIAAILYVFRCLVGQEIPLNAGCLKPLKIKIPDKTFLNPDPPGAVVAGNVETSQCVTNALFLALGKLAASQGTMNNLTFGNEKYQYYETIAGGAGAGEGIKGASARQVHMTNSRLTDPEILEWRFPVRVEEFSIRKQSGGKGKWKGGNGVVRKIRVLEDMDMSILSGHREIAPPGLNAGENGKPGKNLILRKTGKQERLKGADKCALETGDIISIETPGGGGFGKEKS